MSKHLASPLLLLALATSSVALAARGQADQQHIPRQTHASTAAIQGIARTEGGLGLGGVTVILQDLSKGKSFPTTTTGDGVFRFLNVKPGRYQVKASRDGFEPFAQGDIELKAGDVFALEFTLKANPTGSEGIREIPRDPALGPKPAGPSARGRSQLTLSDIAAGAAAGRHWGTSAAGTSSQRRQGVQRSAESLGLRFSGLSALQRKGRVSVHERSLVRSVQQEQAQGRLPHHRKSNLFGFFFHQRYFRGWPAHPGSERLPAPRTPAARSSSAGFRQFFISENLTFSFDLFHGDTSFRPVDWRVKITPEVNINYLNVQENGIVNVDVRKGVRGSTATLDCRKLSSK